MRWVLTEERAEGGDALAARARADPQWLAGFTRVAEGGGLVLYRKDPEVFATKSVIAAIAITDFVANTYGVFRT